MKLENVELYLKLFCVSSPYLYFFFADVALLLLAAYDALAQIELLFCLFMYIR